MPDPLRLTIAIPLYNEKEVFAELLQRVTAVLDQLESDGTGPHRLLFIDDGSQDGTRELLEKAAKADERVVAVLLSRNFGHQAALSAALEHAEGDAVVLMDGDLQDSPEAIPQMIEAFEQGYDVVYGVRANRKEGFVLRSCYTVFYWTISRLSNVALPRGAGDFCLMSRRVVDHLASSPERQRYLRGLRAWVGFRQTGIPIEREVRAGGRSKYSWRSLFKLAFDGIFSFSIVPLRIATLLGMLTVGISSLAALYSLYGKLVLKTSPAGFTWLAMSIAFFAGIQLVVLGVIGEYVGRIYEEVKRRPIYVVDQVLGRKSSWNPNTHNDIEGSTTSTGGGDPGNW